MKWSLWLASCCLVWASDTPRLFYSKSFPRSTPPYVAITLDRNGNAEYKESPEDDQPVRFQVPESELAQIFRLTDKLERFTRPLESPLKVAFTGAKTFRFENGSETNEVQFNYSEDADARLLADWFERIAETEQHRISLERAAKYDKLGVHKALLLLQASLERKRLVAPQQLLPMLDRIAQNGEYLHMARERAAGLAETIRAAK